MAESTIETVRRLCSQSDYAAAREAAQGITDIIDRCNLMELFRREPRPDVTCQKCGADLVEFDRRLLKWFNASNCTVCREREEEQEREQRRQAARLQLLENIEPTLLRCGVPERFTIPPSSVAPIALNMVNSGKGFFFSGQPGTGKTTLACAIMRALVEQAEVVSAGYGEWRFKGLPLFVYVPDLLTMIKGTWDRGAQESESQLLDRYGSVPVLIFDDLGVSYSTEWSHSIFDALIDRRYREMRRTIITSNLSLQGVADKFNAKVPECGNRIASRISAMCEVRIIKGPDRRLK